MHALEMGREPRPKRNDHQDPILGRSRIVSLSSRESPSLRGRTDAEQTEAARAIAFTAARGTSRKPGAVLPARRRRWSRCNRDVDHGFSDRDARCRPNVVVGKLQLQAPTRVGEPSGVRIHHRTAAIVV